jgi:putative DNA primase/helicase
VSDFITFARAHGVDIDPAKLYPSEKIRRCGTVDKPRSTNGAFFWDGERGWVFNWAEEARVQWYRDDQAKPWTDAEKRAWAARRQSARADTENRYRNAALFAQTLIRSTVPGPHDYLTLKGFPDVQGMVAGDGALIIPMRSLPTNELQGAQVIRWEEEERKWVKKMVPGMRAKGAVLRIGDKTAPETILCEGYATGLSIAAALRSVGLRASVLICFSASNMEFIAPQLKGRCFVFADNDKSQTGEKSAKATGLPYCMSLIEGEDANDLHARAGLMAVCQLLMEVRRR